MEPSEQSLTTPPNWWRFARLGLAMLGLSLLRAATVWESNLVEAVVIALLFLVIVGAAKLLANRRTSSSKLDATVP